MLIIALCQALSEPGLCSPSWRVKALLLPLASLLPKAVSWECLSYPVIEYLHHCINLAGGHGLMNSMYVYLTKPSGSPLNYAKSHAVEGQARNTVCVAAIPFPIPLLPL